MRRPQVLGASLLLIGLMAALPPEASSAVSPPLPDFVVTDLGPAQEASLDDAGAVCLVTEGAESRHSGKTIRIVRPDGRCETLPPLPGSRAADGCCLTSDGTVVAYSGDSRFSYRSGLWKTEAPKEQSGYGAIAGYRTSSIVAINSRSHVAGTLGDLSQDWFGVGSGPLYPHAFLYRDGVLQDLGTLGGRVSYATGLSEHDAVIGASQGGGPLSETKNGLAGLVFHAFLWKNGVMRGLGDPPGDAASRASAINDAGQVVGMCDVECAGQLRTVKDATLWQDGRPQNLNYRVTLPRDWHLDDAIAINSPGWILASGHCKDETRFFLLTPPR